MTKRIFDLTPSQIITKARIAAASQILLETDKSVAEIAYAVGFYDHIAFTRAFRSAIGLTPSEFKSKSRDSRVHKMVHKRQTETSRSSQPTAPPMTISRIFAHRVELPLVEGFYKWSGACNLCVSTPQEFRSTKMDVLGERVLEIV